MNIDTGKVLGKLEDESMMDFLKRMGGTEENVVPVAKEDMTDDQKKRLEKNDQPVVRLGDKRSKLAKQRSDLLKRRKQNKVAKAARKKNRK